MNLYVRWESTTADIMWRKTYQKWIWCSIHVLCTITLLYRWVVLINITVVLGPSESEDFSWHKMLIKTQKVLKVFLVKIKIVAMIQNTIFNIFNECNHHVWHISNTQLKYLCILTQSVIVLVALEQWVPPLLVCVEENQTLRRSERWNLQNMHGNTYLHEPHWLFTF